MREKWRWALLGTFPLVGAVLGACGVPFTATGGSSSSGAGSGGSASTASSSQGGAGGKPVCSSNAECEAMLPVSDCPMQAKCKDGACTATFVSGDAMYQPQGTCTKVVCDNKGHPKVVDSATNVANDGNDCTIDGCDNGQPTATPGAPDAPCTTSTITNGICTGGSGSQLPFCGECDATHHCNVAQVCRAGLCSSPVCDVQCGGACPPCDAGQACNLPADCASGVCTGTPGARTCSAPTCSDNVKNGLETGTDCGGPDCHIPCDTGSPCVYASDCTSGVCTAHVCVAPSCTDGVKNGDEQDIDCGGATSHCPPCAP